MNPRDRDALFKELKPLILGLVGGTQAIGATGQPIHTLDGYYHSGTLDDHQAPQFLMTDGSRDLTGDLDVDVGIKIDGVDISAHAGDSTLHHNPVSLGAGSQNPLALVGQTLTLTMPSIGAGTGLTGGGILSQDRSLAVDLASNFLWTGNHKFGGISVFSGEIGSDFIPANTDAFDLGSASKMWRKAWVSEFDATLFAQHTMSLIGGWLIVSKGEGTLPNDVLASDTVIDFGQTMTENDFVLFRANGQVEYMTIGTAVSGGTAFALGLGAFSTEYKYNVTRNVDGSGANAWAAGTPFCILGQSGDGRIELNANDTPRISIIEQGADYNEITEVVRIGDLNGAFGVSSEVYGCAMGDYTAGNYMRYDPTGGFIISAGDGDVTIDASGITLTVGAIASDTMKWSNGSEAVAQLSARYSEGAGNSGYFTASGINGSPRAELVLAAYDYESNDYDCTIGIVSGSSPGVSVVGSLNVNDEIRSDTGFNHNGTSGASNTSAGTPKAISVSGGIVTSVTKVTPVADGNYNVQTSVAGYVNRITVSGGIITGIQLSS